MSDDLPLNRQLFSKSIIRLFIWISLSVVLSLGIIGIAGSIFNISYLNSFNPLWSPIRLLSSICFFIAAVALLIDHLGLKANLFRILSLFIAGIICIGSLITIYTHIILATGNDSFVLRIRFAAAFYLN